MHTSRINQLTALWQCANAHSQVCLLKPYVKHRTLELLGSQPYNQIGYPIWIKEETIKWSKVNMSQMVL